MQDERPLSATPLTNTTTSLRPRFTPPATVADQHNLQDERTLPATPLSPTHPPHFGRALTCHDFRLPNVGWASQPTAAIPTTTTCKMNGRYPQHLSPQHNHLTSAEIYAAHDRCRPPQLAERTAVTRNTSLPNTTTSLRPRSDRSQVARD
jgi:hypothetical protein